jgi:hypothetical protein
MMSDFAPQYFPAGESALRQMNSVAAQLSFSKGAWFREDESLVNEQERSGALHGLVIGLPSREDLAFASLGNAGWRRFVP